MDRWTDECTDRWKVILLSQTLTMRGSDVASLFIFRPVI